MDRVTAMQISVNIAMPRISRQYRDQAMLA